MRRKPAFYAAFGVRELWVIDAAQRVVHVHTGPGTERYASVTVRTARDRLLPGAAPEAFAVALDDLEDL